MTVFTAAARRVIRGLTPRRPEPAGLDPLVLVRARDVELVTGALTELADLEPNRDLGELADALTPAELDALDRLTDTAHRARRRIGHP